MTEILIAYLTVASGVDLCQNLEIYQTQHEFQCYHSWFREMIPKLYSFTLNSILRACKYFKTMWLVECLTKIDKIHKLQNK